MEPLINLIVWIVVFCCVAYGAFWICDRSGFPVPVKWIIGVILLIALLYFLAAQVGGGSFRLEPPFRR